jgi:hypothetical protein
MNNIPKYAIENFPQNKRCFFIVRSYNILHSAPSDLVLKILVS